jgi:dihydrodipicolinate synthase/N-acetylneuraminate lyase
MTDGYTPEEVHLVFLAKLYAAFDARDWPKARAIWRQLESFHHLDELQAIDTRLTREEALMALRQSRLVH